MEAIRKGVCILGSIFVGTALLSGAGVMFDHFYKFPKNAACFILMLIVFIFLIQTSLKLTSRKKR